jgi:multiple sugar transport system ATP-binding protein
MRIELQKLHRELAATIIYVTHDQVEAMTLGTRIAVLNKGKVMQIDTPLHLYNKPQNRFVAGFIGSPTMNFIKGIIVQNDETFFATHQGNCKIKLSEKDSSLLKNYLSKPFELGVRPEHIIICEDEEDGKPDCTLTVVAYENMGNEQLVYFTFGEQTLIVRRSPKDTLEYGKEKGIRFDIEKLLFMDEASQEVVFMNDK